jgi:hypothetical protein
METPKDEIAQFPFGAKTIAIDQKSGSRNWLPREVTA